MRCLAVAAVVVGASLFAADAAMACSCVPPNETRLLRESDGAFVGRLLAVRGVGSGPKADFIYRVRRVYKRGPGLRRGRKVSVRSIRFEVTCGLQSQKDELYALFLQRRNHRWHSNLCLTTTPRRMRHAAELLSGSSAASPAGAGCT